LEKNIEILFGWIPGHAGVEYNEIADGLARETAHEIQMERLSAPSFITYTDACKLSADIARKSWQRKWNQEISES